jgi:hypothetical protein
MITRQKTLRLYAKNRSLPAAAKLSTVTDKWLDYAQQFANNLNDTSSQALIQRTENNVYGTEVEDYSSLTKYYNQRYFTGLMLPSEISQIKGIHHLRFGVLEKDAIIPFHLDDPYNQRFICLIQGSHKYYVEHGNTYNMHKGELWYINGSFKHSVENTSTGIRIALLGKFPSTEENLRLINELL